MDIFIHCDSWLYSRGKSYSWRCCISFVIVIIKRNIRTPSEYIFYGLYFYFSGLSLRKVSYRTSSCFIKRNRVSNWNCMDTKIQTKKDIIKEKESFRVFLYTQRRDNNQFWFRITWLDWIAIYRGLKTKRFLEWAYQRCGICFGAEHFLSNIIKEHDKKPVSTDGGGGGGGMWYPWACQFLQLNIIFILLLRKASVLKEQCNT